VIGKAVQYEGTLRRSGFVWRRPSRYRLVRFDAAGRAFTSCYVLGNETQLAGITGQKLLIKGREYWIQGAQHPVVVPEQIVRRK